NANQTANFTAISTTPTPTPTPTPATYSINGMVTYADSSAGVNNVLMTLSGDSSQSPATDVNGSYLLSGLPVGGTYTTTPSKSGDVNGKITPNDASVIRKALVGKLTLTANQITAADVDKDGSLTPTDPSYIQKALVGKFVASNFTGTWLFKPASTQYS